MPKSFWKGVISFGLVAIPVKMYVATQTKTLSFHLLHSKCLTRPKQVLYCEQDNEYFTLKDTIRAYEFSEGDYMPLTESDFEKVPIKTSRAIEISGFVDEREIDPIYYYASHYVEPEELGIKPFALFSEALRKTHRAAIAKVVFQKREHLCCLRPIDDVLVLQTMHYPDEVLPHEEVAAPKQALTPKELGLAVSLIEAMSGPFKPESFKDEYASALQKLVDAKLAGKEIRAPKPARVEIPDLMAALRASVEAAKTQKPVRIEETPAVVSGRSRRA